MESSADSENFDVNALEIRLINGKIFSLHLDDADVWNNEITTTIKTQNMKNENLKFN